MHYITDCMHYFVGGRGTVAAEGTSIKHSSMHTYPNHTEL